MQKYLILLVSLGSIAAWVAQASPTVMQIAAPQDYEVVQRNDSGVGHLNVSLSSQTEGSFLHLLAQNAAGATVTDQQQPLVSSGGQKVAAFTLPDGGWYRIRLQEVDKTGTVLSENSVEHVGVGEVFLTAGQSNSVAAGEKPQASDDLVSAASIDDAQTKLSWRHAVDNTDHGTPWPVFANALARRLRIPVAILEVGCGGTDVAQWLPASVEGAKAAPLCGGSSMAQAGALFERLAKTSQLLSSYGSNYRAILWHQGETDTIESTSYQDYRERMITVLQSLDQRVGFKNKWLIANVAYVPGSDIDAATCSFTSKPSNFAKAMLAVRRAQQDLWNSHLAFPGPDTDGLVGKLYRYPGPMGVCIHFSDQGLKLHGLFWYRTLLESKLIADLSAEALPTMIPLYRFRSPSADYLFTSTPTTVPGYQLEGPTFSIETQANAENTPLNECQASGRGHFLSTAGGCEGGALLFSLGYVSQDAARAGARPLYRMTNSRGISSTISTTSMDEILNAAQMQYTYEGFTAYAF